MSSLPTCSATTILIETLITRAIEVLRVGGVRIKLIIKDII